MFSAATIICFLQTRERRSASRRTFGLFVSAISHPTRTPSVVKHGASSGKMWNMNLLSHALLVDIDDRHDPFNMPLTVLRMQTRFDSASVTHRLDHCRRKCSRYGQHMAHLDLAYRMNPMQYIICRALQSNQHHTTLTDQTSFRSRCWQLSIAWVSLPRPAYHWMDAVEIGQAGNCLISAFTSDACPRRWMLPE